MPDDISALGWLVILCCLALGFGVVRFMLTVGKDDPGQAPASQAWPDSQADR